MNDRRSCCLHCEHGRFGDYVSEGGMRWGFCWRFPPRVFIVNGATKSLSPRVREDNVCGMFVPVAAWRD